MILLPASQYIANAKMKPDETRDLVEFAVKLQNDVLFLLIVIGQLKNIKHSRSHQKKIKRLLHLQD